MVQINQNRGYLIVNVSCLITSIPNQLIIMAMEQIIPNGCLDAYEVKVNIDIFKYQEEVKLISQFQRFSSFFTCLLEFSSLSLNNCKNILKCLHPLGM